MEVERPGGPGWERGEILQGKERAFQKPPSARHKEPAKIEQEAVAQVQSKQTQWKAGVMPKAAMPAAPTSGFIASCIGGVKSFLTTLFHRSTEGKSEPKKRAGELPSLRPLSSDALPKVSLAAQRASIGKPHRVRDFQVPVDESRTRRGLVNFADQLCVSGAMTADLVMAKLEEAHLQVLAQYGGASSPECAAFDAALLQPYKHACEELETKRKGLELRPAFNGLSEEEIARLNSIDPSVKKSGEEHLKTALAQPVTSSAADARYVSDAKAEAKKVVKECTALSSKIVDQAIAYTKENPGLDEKERAALIKEFEKIRGELPGYYDDMRATMLHAQEEWSREKPTEFPVAIVGKDGQEFTVKSTFQAAGRPWGSQLARNRNAWETCVPNFFKTGLSVKEGETAFEATRGATVVEFGLEDPIERAATTRANVKQILDYHTANAVVKLPKDSEKGNSPADPVVVKYMHTMLFTPDRVRNFAANLSEDLCPAVNNERFLAEETIAANEHWNQVTADQPRLEKIKLPDGTEKEVWVKYDIRTTNFPCCRYQEKMTSNAIKRMLVRHPQTNEINEKTLVKMEQDMKEVLPSLMDTVSKCKAGMEPSEKKLIDDTYRMINAKLKLREQISKYTLQGKPIPPHLLTRWQKTSDPLAQLVRTYHGGDALSKDAQTGFEALVRMDRIYDLHAEVSDLVRTEAYMHPDVVDRNRYRIASYMMFLGNELDVALHFGCRSAKDRTGLQDSDVKEVVAETEANGRIPTYFEAETEDQRLNHREMDAKSGNADFNPRANFGVAWWNLKDSRLETPGRQEEYDAYQAANAAFIRPVTSGERKGPRLRSSHGSKKVH